MIYPFQNESTKVYAYFFRVKCNSKPLKQILQHMQLRSQILKWQKKEHLKQGQETVYPDPDPDPHHKTKRKKSYS
ncbi:MAG: hypothetical protein ACJ72R_05365 [Nitrososphaeraceae archaeon]